MWFSAPILLCFASLGSVFTEKPKEEKKPPVEEWDPQDESQQNDFMDDFNYDLEDRSFFNIQHRKEERLPNGTVTGSYGLLEPDGSIRMVHYVADENGYRAFVENGDNSSFADAMPDNETISDKLKPLKHLSNDDLMHVPTSPLLVTAINSMKQLAAASSSIHEVHERPSSQHYHGRNISDFYIFIPDKILIRREVDGKQGEFITDEVDTSFDLPGTRSLVKRSADPAPKLALAKINLPPNSPLHKRSLMFLLNEEGLQRRKRQLTGQNGQFVTVQQEGNGAPPQTMTYSNQENAPPQEGFYEKIAPKVQDFTQNLANQWANYASNQQPLQPVLNALPRANGAPYVMNVPADYSKQTYRYPLNDGQQPSGEYAAPMNQQYNAAPPVNNQYDGPPGPPPNQAYGPPPNQVYSSGPNQAYNVVPNQNQYGPVPSQSYPMNVEINGAPAGPDSQYGPPAGPDPQYGPPDVGSEDQFQGQQGGVVLPPGYGQYNGPQISTNPATSEAPPFNIPQSVPTSYTGPVNIPQQAPYPDAHSNPIIPPASYPSNAPNAPPMQYNNLNAPIGDHLNNLDAPAVSQLSVQQFNAPYGVGISPYIKVVPQEVDPNEYNLFNRPTGRQTGPSSPRPLPTDPDYYTNYYGNPYDPLDTNALKKQRVYIEPDVNRHNKVSNAQRPYDIVQTGNSRYYPNANGGPVPYASAPVPVDSGQQPSSPAPILDTSSTPPPPSLPPPSLPPPSLPPPPPASEPKTRIIYYDENIKA